MGRLRSLRPTEEKSAVVISWEAAQPARSRAPTGMKHMGVPHLLRMANRYFTITV